MVKTPNISALMSDMRGLPADVSPVFQNEEGVDRLSGRIAPYRTPYRLTEAEHDNEGNQTKAPTFTPETYIYWRMNVEDFRKLIEATNPVGRLPGGTEVVCAEGSIPLDLDPDEDGQWGTCPIWQHRWM